jgi:VWFA-related protein
MDLRRSLLPSAATISDSRFRGRYCALVIAVCCVQLTAQSLTPHPQTTLKSKAEDVLLDVVVRDKKGRLITGLKADDFHIFDNGQPKAIDAFRLVQGREAVQGGGVRSRLDPLQEIRLITMVFQSASPNARRLAHDAAADLLRGELPQNVYIAVMKIDHKLQIVQGFTNDIIVLRKAIDAVARGESTDFTRDAQLLKEQLEHGLGPGFDDPLLSQTNQGANTGINTMAHMDEIMLSIYYRTKRAAQQEAGKLYVSALLDVVAEQYRLPGRKTVLYFSEGGFKIPEGGAQWVRNLISTANRSNVSLYAIDTSGLTISDPNHDVVSQLHGAGLGSGVMSGPAFGNGDFGPDITRGNPQMSLAYIAESTGGELIANTNDFRGPLRKVAEDAETYYEISYAPRIKNYDGSFHHVTVKLQPPDLRVQSRSGYFALPPSLEHSFGGLEAYEVPLLTALASVPLPHAFDFHSAAMHFQNQQGDPVCLIAIDVPFSNLTFHEKEHQHFEAHLSYVALVKDGNGEVLEKFRNEIPISVTREKLGPLKASHFIYTEYFNLPPGHYDLETAVLDSEDGNRISARKSSLVLLERSSALSISTVTFVRNWKDDLPGKDRDPLRVGDKVVSPALYPVIMKAQGADVPFYLVAYPDSNIAAAPKLMLEISKDGRSLGEAVQSLGTSDQSGRIQYVGRLAAASLEPGEYTVRFLLQQGNETAAEAAFFTVQ